jgi:hypothetical protein
MKPVIGSECSSDGVGKERGSDRQCVNPVVAVSEAVA